MLSSRLLIVLLITSLLNAQLPSAKPPATAKADADPLGRSTPRGTVVGFLRAAHENKYGLAVQYLESPRDSEVAKQLAAVLDAALLVNLNDISADPYGRLSDSLLPDRERVGTVHVGGATLDIMLHRVNSTWLFSSETLRHIPAVYEDLAPDWLERFVPGPLKNRQLFGVQVWRLIALLIVIPIALGIAWLIGILLLSIGRRFSKRTPAAWKESVAAILKGPLRLFLAVLLFHAGVQFLGLPLLFRQWLAQLELVVGVFAIGWFALRLIDMAASETRQVLIRNQRAGAISMVPLGRRIVKVTVVSLAVLAVLDNAGFDLKAVLTGLGVGGIAVALAAQKTLENIFGGVAIVADQPVRVGDFCKFGDYSGTVEDIGLRSTRIRTIDRTLISVPNGAFSGINIENFSPRDKYCFHPTLMLRLDTTAGQLRQVLVELQKLLSEHSKIEAGGRVKLVGFGNAALNLEVFSYILTADYNEFMAIQEDLLLRVLEIVEAAGTSLAIPPRTTFLAQDRGVRPPS